MAKTKKKVKKISKAKSVKKTVKGPGKQVGKITHYFSNIEVAVIDLSAPLKTSETVRVIGGNETDFKQKIKSMQVDHKDVKKAKKGDSIGLKVEERVREGYKIYKI